MVIIKKTQYPSFKVLTRSGGWEGEGQREFISSVQARPTVLAFNTDTYIKGEIVTKCVLICL